MAETTAVFDKLVFDFGFDIVDVIPTLLKVSVEREYQRIQAGQAVAVTIFIIDETTTFGKSYPFNPANLPQITLYNPDSSVRQSATNMEQLERGIFTYRYQTSVNDIVGAYSAVFTCINGSITSVSRKFVVYTIIAP